LNNHTHPKSAVEAKHSTTETIVNPTQAYLLLAKGDPDRIVPPLYRSMPRTLLRDLVREIEGIVAGRVEELLIEAIFKPERLHTPARRRVAFLQHFAHCQAIGEAAARTGVDRRTVTRWRRQSPAFDRRLTEVNASIAERYRAAMSH
jgi:hypothetical protein